MTRRVPGFLTMWLSILVPAAAVQATPACGGIVEEDMGLQGGNGGIGWDGRGGTGGVYYYDTGGRYSSTGGRAGGYCGDGVVDLYEDCDGYDLNGATCATATGVMNAYGTLSCTRSCYYDTYQCYVMSTGGAWNAGGYVGMGGYFSAGGQWGGGAIYRDAGAPLPPPLPAAGGMYFR